MLCLSRIDSIHLYNLHVPGSKIPIGKSDRLFSCQISVRENQDAAWLNHYESEEASVSNQPQTAESSLTDGNSLSPGRRGLKPPLGIYEAT